MRTPFIVGICGPSGSGKSSLARKLAKTFAGTLISTDDYFFLNPPHKKYRSKGKNWELPQNVDWQALATVLRGLKLGRTVVGRRMMWETETYKARSLLARRLIVVEGFLLLHDKRIRSLLDFAVYLDVSDEVGIQRRMKREKSTKNERWFRTVTFPEYAKRRKVFASRADLLIDSEQSPAFIVTAVTRAIRSQM